jgi:hypothetical protein
MEKQQRGVINTIIYNKGDIMNDLTEIVWILCAYSFFTGFIVSRLISLMTKDK